MNSDLKEQRFWKKFAKTTWEKKSLLAKKFKSPVQEIDQEEIFSMLVNYSDQCRKLKSAKGFKLYIDGYRQNEEEILQILPQKKDKSLQNYHLRMEEVFTDYCLVCDELLQVSQNNWNKLQNFTENLFAHVGFPNRFAELGLYLGNYRKTPFGVHVDGCGVFSFPVVGKKIFRLWKPNFAKKHPELVHSDQYSHLKKNSSTLRCEPGDMAYWPSSAWHIAESDGSFSATWSLGVWVDRTHLEVIEDAIRPLMKFKLGISAQAKVAEMPLSLKTGKMKDLPETYLQTIRIIKKMTKNQLHDTFLKNWLIHSSKSGFKNFPVTSSKGKFSLQSRIQIGRSQKILWANLKADKKTLFAFQGILIETEPSNNLQVLISDLNFGKTCLISSYLKGPSRKNDMRTLRYLISKF